LIAIMESDSNSDANAGIEEASSSSGSEHGYDAWDDNDGDDFEGKQLDMDEAVSDNTDKDEGTCCYCKLETPLDGELLSFCCKFVCSPCLETNGAPLCLCDNMVILRVRPSERREESEVDLDLLGAQGGHEVVSDSSVASELSNSSLQDSGDEVEDVEEDEVESAIIVHDSNANYNGLVEGKLQAILDKACERDRRMFSSVHQAAIKHTAACFTEEMKQRVALNKKFKCCSASGKRYEMTNRKRKVVDTPEEKTEKTVAALKRKATKACKKLAVCNCVDPSFETVVMDVYAKISAWSQKSSMEKRVWLGTIVSMGQTTGPQSVLTTGVPFNKKLCQPCFCAYNGVGNGTLYQRIKEAKNGRVNWEHSGSGRKRTRVRGAAMQWLALYAKKCGDYMPHKEGEIHLPDYYWTHVYCKMIAHLGNSEGWGVLISNARFRQMGKAEMSWIKIRKYKCFAKCTTCSKLDERIEKSFGYTKLYWKEKKDKHLKWQMQEREKYYKHRAKSRDLEGSQKCICLSIDSMDHSKTALPSKARDDKETEHAAKLHTHLTGVLAHGVVTEAICYTWHDRFPAASDVVMTIILDVLAKITKSRGKLPPTLYLHLDNCWRENKNK
jgi:hypothetical protein